jgi:hypothetical protein
MKVIVRSSSLLFFFVTLLLGLPIRRRPLGNSDIGADGRGGVEENLLTDGGGIRFGWKVLTPRQKSRAAHPVTEQ